MLYYVWPPLSIVRLRPFDVIHWHPTINSVPEHILPEASGFWCSLWCYVLQTLSVLSSSASLSWECIMSTFFPSECHCSAVFPISLMGPIDSRLGIHSSSIFFAHPSINSLSAAHWRQIITWVFAPVNVTAELALLINSGNSSPDKWGKMTLSAS